MKKVLLRSGIVIGSIALIVIGAAAFSAFESHIINVTARIENALSVPLDEIEFGTVFPQERLDQTFDISFSESFLEEEVGEQCASSVVSSAQGVRKNGTAVLVDRSDPTKALGLPQSSGAAFDNPVVAGSFYSLGFTLPDNAPEGGSVTLGFTNFLVDVAGTDMTVYEVTGGTVYPEERVRVEVSQDGVIWETAVASGLRDVAVDISGTSFDRIKFVRITDVSVLAPFEATADAYDLDAVCGTSRSHAGIVDYIIRQKPKCGLPVDAIEPTEYSAFGLATEGEADNFECVDEGFVPLPLLCPYLSKHEITTDGQGENDIQGQVGGPWVPNGLNAFHGLPGPWTPAATLSYQVQGALSAVTEDLLDTWNIDLRVPAFQRQAAQDWADFVHEFNPDADPGVYLLSPSEEHEIFGCDLWVEVTDIS